MEHLSSERSLGRIPFRLRLVDTLATMLITVGGIGTILALLLVVLVLLAKALPLARDTRVGEWTTLRMPYYRQAVVDEQGSVLWGLTREGGIEVLALHDNEKVATYPAVFNDAITCSKLSIDQQYISCGLENGQVVQARVEFEDRLLAMQELDSNVELTRGDPPIVVDGALYQWFDESTVREIQLQDVEWEPPIQLAEDPILALDFIPAEAFEQMNGESGFHCAAIAGQSVILHRRSEWGTDSFRCDLKQRSQDGVPIGIGLLSSGDQVLVVWEQGIVDRYALSRDRKTPAALNWIEAQASFIGSESVSCVTSLMGRQSIVCGTQEGNLLSWTLTTRTAPSTGTTGDPYQLSLLHCFQVSDFPIVAVSSSERAHVVAAMDSQHRLQVCHPTTERVLATSSPHVIEGREDIPPGALRSSFVLLNSEQRVALAASFNQVSVADVDIAFPNASAKGFFASIWYESQAEPGFHWQPAASQSSEVKLSFVPLLFGSLKAACFALLFATPLGIAGAIYTSEFASPTLRRRVKPAIELIASFPSVVVGFVAAYLAAPLLASQLLGLVVWAVLLPPSILLVSRVGWVSRQFAGLGNGMGRLWVVAALTISSFFLSVGVAWLIEAFWLQGSLVEWIDRKPATAAAGWNLLFLPAGSIIATLFVARRRVTGAGTVASLVIAVLIVAALSWGLVAFGWDVRQFLSSGYREQNSLLLGIALGFCVMPIIFTLADDALDAVPNSLRKASLACGATPWQTTRNVVLPAAASGVLSGVLIAFARAAGETMLVLTAVANTPVLEWSPFSGLKSITSALITELPEATEGGAHFRTLFLAAFLLFAFTLAINTFAEFLKIRYRRRMASL